MSKETISIKAEERTESGSAAAGRLRRAGFVPAAINRIGGGTTLLKINQHDFKALLKRLGNYDIVLASDGNEALEKLHEDTAHPFALVLTDYWMPNLDGEGLLKAIRANPALASLRVIAVTANMELRGKAAELGFDDILLKPINTAELTNAIFETK